MVLLHKKCLEIAYILKPYIPMFLWFTQISRKTAHNKKTQYLYSFYFIFIEFMGVIVVNKII